MPTTDDRLHGLIEGMPEAEYHGLDGYCSASQLKRLDTSTPLHVQCSVLADADTPALRLGRALHCRVLEPRLYPQQYITAPDVDRRTKAGKAAYAEFEDSAGDATVLKHAEAEQVNCMAESIEAHPLARDVLGVASLRECSVFAGLFGVACRSRIDAMTPDSQIVVDIKSTAGLASTREMEMAVWKFGYGLQMCVYREMLRANGREPEAMIIIAVEKSVPHAVQCFVLEPDVLDLHVPRLERLLHKWAETIGSHTYPAWSQSDFTPIGVPDWAKRDLELEAEMSAAIEGRTA